MITTCQKCGWKYDAPTQSILPANCPRCFPSNTTYSSSTSNTRISDPVILPNDIDELNELEREIVSEKEPDQFIDLLAAQHYFAGQFGNKIPVDSARRMFEAWLTAHDQQVATEALDSFKDHCISAFEPNSQGYALTIPELDDRISALRANNKKEDKNAN